MNSLKKKLFVLFTFVMIICCSIPSFAATSENSKVDKNIFLSTPKISQSEDGLYSITLSKVSELANRGNETELLSSELKILDLDKDEMTKISKGINDYKNSYTSRDTTYNVPGDPTWFLGYSCYIYMNVNVTRKTISPRTYYKINRVDVEYGVNSGTTISSKVLYMGALGSGENNEAVNFHTNVNVPYSPYSDYSLGSLPFIDSEGTDLGASFVVTAVRPSGESKTVNTQIHII